MDYAHRLARIDYPDTADTLYTYGKTGDAHGAAGKILRVDDAFGAVEYGYGRLDEVVKETRTLNTHLNGLNATTEYRSDYLGRMQWIVYPDGERVTYGYDSLYQLIRVDGETAYNPHRSATPEFISTHSQTFEFMEKS